MPETVLFESENRQTRAEIATYLRQVAEKLDAGESITLQAGSQSRTLEPPARLTFEVKAEREGPETGPGELSVEFELEWDEAGEDASEGQSGLEIR
ncbi:MAG: amphi-Trp domain-containing protein [Halodesulfurarchaeum sp.]|nr:amphi-Trp domain-containing protein [Halodesulfurarchaeum sp.]